MRNGLINNSKPYKPRFIILNSIWVLHQRPLCMNIESLLAFNYRVCSVPFLPRDNSNELLLVWCIMFWFGWLTCQSWYYIGSLFGVYICLKGKTFVLLILVRVNWRLQERSSVITSSSFFIFIFKYPCFIWLLLTTWLTWALYQCK